MNQPQVTFAVDSNIGSTKPRSRAFARMETFEGVDIDESTVESNNSMPNNWNFRVMESMDERSLSDEEPIDLAPSTKINGRTASFYQCFYPPRMKRSVNLLESKSKSSRSLKSNSTNYEEKDTSEIIAEQKQKSYKRLRIKVIFFTFILCITATLGFILKKNRMLLRKAKVDPSSSPSNAPFVYSKEASIANSPPSVTPSQKPTSIPTTIFTSTPSSTDAAKNPVVDPKTNLDLFVSVPTQSSNYYSHKNRLHKIAISKSFDSKILPPKLPFEFIQDFHKIIQSTKTPTVSPSINRYNQVRNLLESMADQYQSISVFDDPNSPQSQSLQWLLYYESRNLSFNEKDSTDIIHRWTIALIWFSMSGSQWKESNGWLGDTHECDWFGVTCNSDFRAVQITLNNNNLIGTIPNEIRYLDTLEILNLKRNDIYGTLPTELGDLRKLKKLMLMSNAIQGNIPTQIGKLQELEHLGLGINSFVGVIPDEIGNLSHMTRLELWSNNLEGTLPLSISNLDRLKYLYFDGNFFTGTIPSYLGNLPLEVLSLGDNLLDGSIPSSLSNLIHLKSLWLNKNMLDGTIHTDLFQLSNLKHLYLEENFLSGLIPNQFTASINLIDIRLHDNRFTSCIPSSLFDLPSLTLIYLDKNQFSCNIPINIFESKSIIDVRLSNNELTGVLPSVQPQSSPLEVFEVTDNGLTGTIPASFGNLVSLELLALSRNRLKGTIPAEIVKLSRLETINLENNQFNGTVPDIFRAMMDLNEMRLDNNMFTGTISAAICRKNLKYLTSDCDEAKIECECCNNCS